jgi:hypothetical protein
VQVARIHTGDNLSGFDWITLIRQHFRDPRRLSFSRVGVKLARNKICRASEAPIPIQAPIPWRL